jgi:uncharacterized protein with ParB-like and HNH nuclease domain
MKADSFAISKVFSNGGDIHYLLPYFQREYAWEKSNWETLLNDILDLYDLYEDGKTPEHFMGSLVVVNEGLKNGTVPVFKLVDGQQRLTTISLILCVLANYVKSRDPEFYNKLKKYITNPDEPGELKYKLLPTKKYGDRNTYISIVNAETMSLSSTESRILPAYLYYKGELTKRFNSRELVPEKFFEVIVTCLQIVFINLDNREKPYQIFESLNAKGKPLTQADLVRNYIAMKLPAERQAIVFENYWSEIEELLQEKRSVGRSRLGELTAFLRHYLAFRNGVLGNEAHVYARFRDRIETGFTTTELFEGEIKTLRKFAYYYDTFLRPEKEKDFEIRNALLRLNVLEVSTGYPFLLGLFDSYEQNLFSREDLLSVLRILENYLVRRYLTGEPTNYLTKMFASLWKDIDVEDLVSSIKEVVFTKNYPADYSVLQKGLSRKLYDKSFTTRAKTTLVLESINKHLSIKNRRGGYTVLDGKATIEHILPQRPSNIWKSDLGDSFNQIYDQYLHTIGNLTLVTTPWNTELSNLPFVQKKNKLSEHALELNNNYFVQPISRWDEEAILDRATFLLENVIEIWPSVGVSKQPIKEKRVIPGKLTILGEVYRVSSWRDVAEKTVESIIQTCDNFPAMAAYVPSFLSRQSFPYSDRKLSNGWYLNTNLSARDIMRYVRKLMDKAGLTENDWKIEER